MSYTNDLTNLAIQANALYGAVSANSSRVISLTVGNSSVNTYITANSISGNLNFTSVSTYAANVVLNSGVGVSANGGFGSNGQALTTNGSAVYWSTIVGVNTASQYTFTNTISFTNTLTVNTVLHNNPFLLNGLTVNTSYSIPSGYSAVSAGPITLANGVSVTIPSGSKWVVL